MNKILISIKQKWWEKIIKGEKFDEIRKTWPRKQGPFLVYCYVPELKAVVGTFELHHFIRGSAAFMAERAAMTEEELNDYAGGKRVYGWSISKPRELQEKMPLARFSVKRAPQSWQYLYLTKE